MIFTSYSYLALLIVAFLVHWSLPVRLRNAWLIVVSYAFYACFHWQFPLVLAAVSLFNWWYARRVLARRAAFHWLALGIVANLVPLVYFKYTGFLAETCGGLLHLLGLTWQPTAATLLLPVGISFFTFQNIGYLIDVAAGEEPVERLGHFLLFEAFWPKLTAGPIIRIDELRKALVGPRTLDYDDYRDGCRRILFGLAKKVLLADSLAHLVQLGFAPQAMPHAVDALAATLAAGLQIYFDFSAYSDIAVGSARLFGFRLPENFNWPYLARSPQDFWNRWHMSLSRWIRDYLYTPMAFAARGRPGLNPLWLLIAMTLCGLWHGAAWTFILWGTWHGLLLALNQTWLRRLLSAATRPGRPVLALVSSSATFVLVQLGWLLFQSSTLSQAWDMLLAMLTLRGGLRPAVIRENSLLLLAAVFAALLIAQWVQAKSSRSDWLDRVTRPLLPVLKPLGYALLIIAVIVLDREATAFVYFQF